MTLKTPAERNDTRLQYGDTIRIVAALGVIVQHVSHAGIMQKDMTGAFSWWLCCWANSATRWVVPVFVMLSGAIILAAKRDDSAWTFWRKRLIRVGVPTVFWSVGYMALSMVIFRSSLQDTLMSLLHGHPFYHLHFLFVILGLYAIAPALQFQIEKAQKQDVWAATLFILAVTVVSVAISYFDGSQCNAFTMWIPYTGYFLLGYLLRETHSGIRRISIASALFVASVIWVGLSTGYAFRAYGWGSRLDWFNDFCNPAVMAMSAAVFLLFTWTKPAAWFVGRSRGWAESTMGVYLIHPFVLVAMNKFGVSWQANQHAWNLPISFFLAASISFLSVSILRRSRVARLLLG